MVYSVVETYEKKHTMITAVPTIWIIGDILLWPPQKNVSDYRKKCTVPTKTWKEVKIKRLVRSNIGTKKIYIYL